MKYRRGPGDMYGPEGLAEQLSKTLIERAVRTLSLRFVLTEQLSYEKNSTGGKPAENRRNGKSSKTLRTG
jgi:transposase-like protein